MFARFLGEADPDAALVAAARAGDARAFDALVYRYQSRVRLFVRARLDSAIDAEDVAQEIFVTAWRQLPRFRGRSRFKTWLFGIALNQCAEAARRYRLSRRLIDGAPEPVVCPHGLDHAQPGRWLDTLIEREDIRRSLAALPDAEREVLELYYYAQLNLREIASLLNVNLSTLKYRFYQAHRWLRCRIECEAAPPLEVGCQRNQP